jgi:PAS domain S-box-containing protein
MKTRVLLIDDDHVDQMAFQRKMKETNEPFEIDSAESMMEGKRKLSENKYDIVLVDMSLGDGTAFDLFDKILHTPCVVITGENKADVAVEAMRSGASDYVVKDMNRSYLTLLPTIIRRTIHDYRLSEQFSLLSEAMGAISDSVYISDENGLIVYVNDGFLKTYGYVKNEIIGQDENVLFDKRAHGTVSTESRHRKKNGSTFPVSLSISQLKQFHITVAHDITERKHMEDALLQAIEKFSKLLNIQVGKTTILEKNKQDIEENYNALKATYETLTRRAA